MSLIPARERMIDNHIQNIVEKITGKSDCRNTYDRPLIVDASTLIGKITQHTIQQQGRLHSTPYSSRVEGVGAKSVALRVHTFKMNIFISICRGACRLHACWPHLFAKLHHAVAMAAA